VSLLERLSRHVELMFVVDDLQWADAESFELLHLLIAHAADLPVLVICTLRPGSELTSEVNTQLAALEACSCAEKLVLRPLPVETATALATRLLGGEGALAADMARESGGHPLFLRELVEHVRRGLPVHAGDRTLDAALEARIASLDTGARQLLSLVALTDKPCGSQVVAHALALSELPL
jgi:hypothetical protein